MERLTFCIAGDSLKDPEPTAESMAKPLMGNCSLTDDDIVEPARKVCKTVRVNAMGQKRSRRVAAAKVAEKWSGSVDQLAAEQGRG